MRSPRRNLANDLFRLNIRIPITVAILVVCLPAIAVILYFVFPSWKDDITFVSSIVVATGAVVSAFYIGRGLVYNSQSQLQTRTLSFPARWNDPGFFHVKQSIHELRKALYEDSTIKNDNDRRNKLQELIDADVKVKLNLTDVFNFFEEMSVCVDRGIVDTELLRRFFRSILVAYYEAFEFWLVDRQRGSSLIFSNIGRLYTRWK